MEGQELVREISEEETKEQKDWATESGDKDS
jgi:hypothetical protein